MTSPPKPDPAERRARLRSALRENLKRRKAQAKARSAAKGQGEPARHDSADIADDKQGR
ncbi:MAG TPA: hypothetical protein VHA77_12275 [Xanthobacteraceae bacterium]|jgi:hypothetical protein|nr:hypothetical protein [Xanthobacteraceae bacterium]